jgi:hypothetical protein
LRERRYVSLPHIVFVAQREHADAPDAVALLRVRRKRPCRHRRAAEKRDEIAPWSGRIEARTGLRMMPTFPRSVIETTSIFDMKAKHSPDHSRKSRQSPGKPDSGLVAGRGRPAERATGLP